MAANSYGSTVGAIAQLGEHRFCKAGVAGSSEKYGDQQSLKHIGQRGGFGRQELVTLIRGTTCYATSEDLNDTRPFPIQDTVALDSVIPWWLAEIAFSNFDNWSGCTLEDVAVRGGWSRYKLVKLLKTSFD